MMLFLVLIAAADGFLVAPQQHSPRTVRSATDDALLRLERRVDALQIEVDASRRARILGIETELNALRQARIGALEAELAALKEPLGPTSAPAAQTTPTTATVASSASAPSVATVATRATVAAAALASVAPPPPPPSMKNDAFLDDELEDLLEIGGDPTFLEQAREKPSSTFEWDGEIDETAHFDDDF